MIAKGTRLKILCEGSTTDTWWNVSGFQPSDLQAGVMNILSKKFSSVSVSVMPRSSVYIGYLGWPYRGEVQLTTAGAFNSADDVASIVANAFYQVGGAVPSACADGYGRCASGASVDYSKEPSSPGLGALGFGLGALVLAGIAVAVFVAKRG